MLRAREVLAGLGLWRCFIPPGVLRPGRRNEFIRVSLENFTQEALLSQKLLRAGSWELEEASNGAAQGHPQKLQPPSWNIQNKKKTRHRKEGQGGN